MNEAKEAVLPSRPPIFHREIYSCGEIKFVPVYRKFESDALFESLEREIVELKKQNWSRNDTQS